MTTAFRENKDKILLDEYKGKHLIANAETFDKAAIDKLLSQKGSEKVRIYYGMDESLQVHAILVGVDAEGRDQLPLNESTSDEDPVIVDVGQRCPPECAESPMNP